MDRPKRDKTAPANFSAPADEVHEVVKTVPYSQRAADKKAKTDALKGKGKPLGGFAPIPEGKLAPLAMAKPDFSEEEPPPINRAEAERRNQKVPPPVGGVGSAYDVNQRLASGDIKKPVSVAEAKKLQHQTSKLSPETAEAVKQMDQSVRETAGEETPVPAFSQEPIPTEEEERQKLDDTDKDLEKQFDFDLDGLVAARNSLLSEERRKKIEGRLEPLDLADMITKREIQQIVPVVPNRFEVSLRTLSQKENLFCLQYVYEFPGSERYVEELHNTSKLVCSLIGINGAPLPDHRENIGQKDEAVKREAFEAKMNQVTSFPVQLMADISVQLIWFNARVNELFNMGNLKNG